jgi:hypothetical protein
MTHDAHDVLSLCRGICVCAHARALWADRLPSRFVSPSRPLPASLRVALYMGKVRHVRHVRIPVATRPAATVTGIEPVGMMSGPTQLRCEPSALAVLRVRLHEAARRHGPPVLVRRHSLRHRYKRDDAAREGGTDDGAVQGRGRSSRRSCRSSATWVRPSLVVFEPERAQKNPRHYITILRSAVHKLPK